MDRQLKQAALQAAATVEAGAKLADDPDKRKSCAEYAAYHRQVVDELEAEGKQLRTLLLEVVSNPSNHSADARLDGERDDG